MKKFQVTIRFEMSDQFIELVSPHRTYINYLINKGIIDHYAVSMETQRSWITFTAEDKAEVEKLMELCENKGKDFNNNYNKYREIFRN